MPFGGEEINETFAQILEKDPQPIRQLVTGVPEGLERIVMKCLAKNREQRFADVAELARALVAFGSGTWIQSADRVHATLVRGLEDAISGPRLAGNAGAPSVRMPLPSSPGRRLESIQPELTGTTNTVAHRFTVLGSRTRNWLALTGVIGVAAIVLIAGTAVQRSRAMSASVAETPSGAGEPPLEATAVAAPGVVTGAVTAPPPPAGAESEPAAAALAAPPTPTSAPAGPAQVSTVAGISAPVVRKAPAPSARPVAASPVPRRPLATGASGKPLLPPGLPRERQ
jgi:serine/threonine-protein kinase